MTSRRQFLKSIAVLGIGYGAVKYGVEALAGLRGLEFEPLTGLAGFRQLDSGQTSGGFDLFAGLEPAPSLPDVRGGLCATLFGDVPAGAVPIASFSDYNCPYCRILTPRLAAMEKQGGIHVAWHELPLLGPVSEFAAKATLAAKRQGAYAALHRRFMQTPVRPGPGYLREAARALGLDATQLLADMNGPKVAAELQDSAALARLFGIIGTPALVVGRTLVVGAIDQRTLERLVERERRDGPVPC